MLRRDFIVIPLISLLTALCLAGVAEFAARRSFEEGGRESCSRFDGLHGRRIAGSCTSQRKSPEGPWTENAYNACGYRTREPCGDRPPGTLRIALLGASTAQGFKVEYDQAFAPRAAAELARRCGRPVEIQNMGVPGYKLIDQYWRVDEALAMKPDVVMLVLSAFELVESTDPQVLARRKDPESLRRPPPNPGDPGQAPPENANLVARIDALVGDSRAVLAAQHYLYLDPARYVRLFMLKGDNSDYLRTPLSSRWEARLTDLELLLGEMAARSRAAGVPFVLLFGPQRVQAALLDARTRTPGIDPEAIDRRVAEIAERTGVTMIDGLDAMKGVAAPERLFYPVDGHMTGDGHALFARTVVEHLIADRVGPFADCRRTKADQRR